MPCAFKDVSSWNASMKFIIWTNKSICSFHFYSYNGILNLDRPFGAPKCKYMHEFFGSKGNPFSLIRETEFQFYLLEILYSRYMDDYLVQSNHKR